MNDRHWMEKWAWDRSVNPNVLRRKKDGKEASGWPHAAEIEGYEKGVTADEILTNPKYQMVPLADTYPDEITYPKDAPIGPREEPEEAIPYAERLQAMEDNEQMTTLAEHRKWAATPRKEVRSLFYIGWTLMFLAALIFLVMGASLVTGLVGLLSFTSGALVAAYILRE